MSTFWSYLSTSPLTSCPQLSSISVWNSWQKLGIPISTDESLRQVNLILLPTPQTLVLSNNVSVVIRGRKITLPDNGRRIKGSLSACFVVCRQLIVGWKCSQSQYRTNLEGQYTTVSSPYSRDRYTGHCASASVQCNWLCWYINISLSHCQYVAVQKYRCWMCQRNPFAELTLIYGSQDESLHIWNGLHAVGWFSGTPEC